MEIYFNGKQKGITIEITSRCMLRCPKCKRTLKGIGHHDLSLSRLKKLAKEISETSPHCNINLTGNCGDAIYHPQFHRILRILKRYELSVWVTTNGSHRPKTWWEETIKILSPTDGIIFSIDGLEDTNPIYRIGSHWHSIIEGFKVSASKVQTIWKMIVFAHNEHQVSSCRDLAKQLGAAQFQIMKSSRFRSQDVILAPKSPEHRSIHLEEAKNIKTALSKHTQISLSPRCKGRNEIYISFNGIAYPCCALWDQNELPMPLLKRLFASSIKSQLRVWEKRMKQSRLPLCIERCGTTKSEVDFSSDIVEENFVKSSVPTQ